MSPRDEEAKLPRVNFMSFATCSFVNFDSWMDLGMDGDPFTKHPGMLKREPS